MRIKLFIVAGMGLAVAAGAAVAALERLYPRVSVASVASGPAVQAVYATGVVEPVTWAKVAPLSMGRIVALEAAEGQPVRRGDVLFRLDDREERARVEELEARRTFLEEQVRRLAALRASGTASQQAFDQAQSDLRQVSANLVAARKRVADMAVASPLDGLVLRRDGEIGETVRDGQTLFWVGPPEPLWITADVDEDDIPLVAVGQPVLIKTDAFPRRVFEGRVARITPKGDAVQRTYRVRVAIPSPSELLIGMVVEINVVIRERSDAALVPNGSVRANRVIVIDGGRATLREVRVGVVGSRMTEIVDGVAPGDRVAVDAPVYVREGSRVRVRNHGGGDATRRF